MKRALLIVGKVIRWIVIAVCVLLCIFIIYSLIQRAMGNNMPTVFGYAGTTVVTGSMDDDSGDDDIEIGDFIIIHAQDSYEVGDVVTFYDSDGGVYVTHRVVDIDGTTYYIRGDTTGERDENNRPVGEPVTDEVPLSAIVGKVVSVISGGGNAIDFMRSTPGLLIIVAAGVIIWFAEDIISSLLNRQKEDEEKED